MRLIALLLLFFLHGCYNEHHRYYSDFSQDNPEFPPQTTLSPTQEIDQNEQNYVVDLFKSIYLWADGVDKDFKPNKNQTINEIIAALKAPQDRWSFYIPYKNYEAINNQKSGGFGFAYTQNYTILYTREGSPASLKLKRGDRLITVNDKPITQATLHEAAKNLQSPTRFGLYRNQQFITLSVTPTLYSYSNTNYTLIGGDKSIGYLRYNGFTEKSVQKITEAFEYFYKNRIDELIVDLRYNPGGSVEVASMLLDAISGGIYNKEVQFKIVCNNQYQKYNSNYYFDNSFNPLYLARIFFLTTPNSASASELVINALIPYLGKQNVITIGKHTHGKPVGMFGFEYKAKRDLFFLINFYIKNANDNHSPFEGISPTCRVMDDFTHQLGDPNELMLKEALFYISNNRCSNAAD